MTRTDAELFYNLLSKQGRWDARWAIRHYGWHQWLIREILGDTWYSFRNKFRKQE